MRTQVSNERALLQATSADGNKVVSIVRGVGYRFIEEQIESVPASDIVSAYDYWAETLRSGVYETIEAARVAAEAEISWGLAWVAEK